LYNGKAYMSLVGFMFKKIKLFNVPMVWQFWRNQFTILCSP
jgi:uncharacterized protein YqjF (DUF2071 family)